MDDIEPVIAEVNRAGYGARLHVAKGKILRMRSATFAATHIGVSAPKAASGIMITL